MLDQHHPTPRQESEGDVFEWEADSGLEFERKTLSGRATIHWSKPVPLSSADRKTGRGVYIIEGKGSLYVGEGNLQDRIRAHKSGLIRLGVPLSGFRVRFGAVRRNTLGSLKNVEHALVRHIFNLAAAGGHRYKLTNREPRAQVKVGAGGIRIGNRHSSPAPPYLRGPIEARVDPSRRVTLFELREGDLLGSGSRIGAGMGRP